MRSIYIAGPYSAPDREGEDRNIRLAAEAGSEYANTGWNPYVPHLIFPYMVRNFKNTLSYDDIMVCCITALTKCDAIHMCKGWRESKGARLEYLVAQALGLEIRGEI